jgi:5'-nucleotidase
MRILLSNDDGYQSAGLDTLARHLEAFAELTVVAPDRDRSGASNSLTLDRPLRATRLNNGVYRVDGTPTDCVHLAITGLLETEPDMVVAGINAGANLGDDVLYSGTVAAATEGRFLGFPALALSINSFEPAHWQTAAQVAAQLIQALPALALDPQIILNVNVPDLPLSEIKGFASTRLGHRHKAEPVVQTTDPRGRSIYWVGPPGGEQDAGPGTDFYALRQGFVSVTPLQVDLTRHHLLDALNQWLEPLAL